MTAKLEDLSERELKILEGLCEKATKLPWKIVEGDKTVDIEGDTKYYGPRAFLFVDRDDCDHDESYANAGFVVHARRALPRALAEIRRLRGQVAALHEELNRGR